MAFPRGLLGLLGFDLGSQSCIPSLPLLPLLPSEFHLGFHLGLLRFLRFRLSSTWDSILDPLVSILKFLPAPAAARSFSAPLTRRSFRHKRLNSDECTLHAGRGKSPLSSGCFAIRRGPCRCPACQRHNTASASATCKPLSNRELGIFRVGIFTTHKMPKAVIICDLRAAPHVSS